MRSLNPTFHGVFLSIIYYFVSDTFHRNKQTFMYARINKEYHTHFLEQHVFISAYVISTGNTKKGIVFHTNCRP